MKVALVYDYLTQYGGGERVLQALTEVFPEAPIFTLLYSEKLTGRVFRAREIRTSFLQRIPLAKSHHLAFLPFMPLAIEEFDLSDYDLVLSVSASYAKGIITKPSTFHICYCFTPLRYAWTSNQEYLKEFRFPWPVKKIAPFIISYLRVWDKEASSRVDKFIANSSFVSQRIRKYYRRKAEVIYPPVETDFFKPINGNSDDFFLMVGRLVNYKRFDLGIEVFNQLGLRLKIIGEGPMSKKLKKMAFSNIEFLGRVSDEKLRDCYNSCQALIFPQEEDFGIVPLEAMACGRPVIAYKAGGALETVKEEKTGIFFKEQAVESLIEAVKKFNPKNFDSQKIREHSLKFSKEVFKEKIKKFIENQYHRWRKIC